MRHWCSDLFSLKMSPVYVTTAHQPPLLVPVQPTSRSGQRKTPFFRVCEDSLWLVGQTTGWEKNISLTLPGNMSWVCWMGVSCGPRQATRLGWVTWNPPQHYSQMKALARAYLWWPGMDTQIAELVKACPVCQESQSTPAAAPLHPWEWPSQPWSRIHLDYAGPFLGHMFLVLVATHSKWMDVHPMQSITAPKTIEKLRIIFATHGLPRKVVTDNGPSFTSEELSTFMLLQYEIVHVTTAHHCEK